MNVIPSVSAIVLLACSLQAQPAGQAWHFTPDPALPNVLLIGDSISIGYTLQVRELLKGKANVFRPMRADGKAPANCQSTTQGRENLKAWLGGRSWHVIHFNWGLHDLCYRHPEAKTPGNRDKVRGKIQVPLEDYRKNLETLLGELDKTGARLIWASTTKVPEDEAGRFVGDDLKYNQVARDLMTARGIAIDDLHAVSMSLPPSLMAGPGNVHYTSQGYRRLAEKVASSIEGMLRR